jgi:hypothetical protein
LILQVTEFVQIEKKKMQTEQPSRSAVTHDADNSKWPSLSTPPTYNSKVAPVKDEKEKDQEKDQVSS